MQELECCFDATERIHARMHIIYAFNELSRKIQYFVEESIVALLIGWKIFVLSFFVCFLIEGNISCANVYRLVHVHRFYVRKHKNLCSYIRDRCSLS